MRPKHYMKSTPTDLPSAVRASWNAERLLLACLLGLGLLGLVMTHGGRVEQTHRPIASSPSDLGVDRRLQRERMIQLLDQRSREAAQQPRLELSEPQEVVLH